MTESIAAGELVIRPKSTHQLEAAAVGSTSKH